MASKQRRGPSKYRAGVSVCIGLVLMFVQVSVADVAVWYSRKEIYGNSPAVFDIAEVEARALHESMGLI